MFLTAQIGISRAFWDVASTGEIASTPCGLEIVPAAPCEKCIMPNPSKPERKPISWKTAHSKQKESTQSTTVKERTGQPPMLNCLAATPFLRCFFWHQAEWLHRAPPGGTMPRDPAAFRGGNLLLWCCGRCVLVSGGRGRRGMEGVSEFSFTAQSGHEKVLEDSPGVGERRVCRLANAVGSKLRGDSSLGSQLADVRCNPLFWTTTLLLRGLECLHPNVSSSSVHPSRCEYPCIDASPPWRASFG